MRVVRKDIDPRKASLCTLGAGETFVENYSCSRVKMVVIDDDGDYFTVDLSDGCMKKVTNTNMTIFPVTASIEFQLEK